MSGRSFRRMRLDVPLSTLTSTEIESFGGYSTIVCRWSASPSQASISQSILVHTLPKWPWSHSSAGASNILRPYLVTQTK